MNGPLGVGGGELLWIKTTKTNVQCSAVVVLLNISKLLARSIYYCSSGWEIRSHASGNACC